MAQRKLEKLSRPELLGLLMDQERQINRLHDELHAADAAAAPEGATVARRELRDYEPRSRADIIARKKLQAQLRRSTYRRHYRSAMRRTIEKLLVVFATSILLCVFLIPVFEMHGTSMGATLQEGDVVLALRWQTVERNDIISFYYGRKLLIKRCIAVGGDVVDIASDGTVYVNGEALEETYVTNQQMGDCDIEFPYTVPANSYFVLSDNRSSELDSRNSLIGCVDAADVNGTVVYTLWPLDRVGAVN